MLKTHSMFLKIKIQKVVHWILKILNKILKRMFSEERKLQFHSSSRKDAYKQLYSPKLFPNPIFNEQ